MSWAEIKHSVNSDLTTPLNVTLGKRDDGAAAAVNTTNSAMAYIKAVYANTYPSRGQMYLANGTFTPPVSGVYYITAISAGGNGGPGYRQNGGGGGSCGNFVIRMPFFQYAGGTFNITVGTGNVVVGNALTLVKGSAGGAASSVGVGTGSKNLTASSDYGAGGPGGSRSASPVTFAGPGTQGASIDGISIFGSPGGAALTPSTTGGGGGGGGVPHPFIAGGTTGAGADCTIYDAAVGNSGGSYGAGGGGGPGGSAAAAALPGGPGGPGVVFIEW